MLRQERLRLGTIERLLHPRAKPDYQELYLHDLDSKEYTSLQINLDEEARGIYARLQQHEEKTMKQARAEKATYKDHSVHSKTSRRVLKDIPIALLTTEIYDALEQGDPNIVSDHLFDLGEIIKWIMVIWRTRPPGGTPQPSQSLSRVGIDEDTPSIAMNWINGSKSPSETVKIQALVRDDFKCLGSGRWERAYVKNYHRDARGPDEKTESCHIVPHLVLELPPPGHLARDEPKVHNMLLKVGTMFAILDLFGMHEEIRILSAENGAHDLSNILTFIHTVHDKFNSLTFWFEQTEIPHQYKLCADEDIPERLLISQVVVNFSDHSVQHGLPEAPLPSPRLLALHAACARVAHMSGAAEYFESCESKRDFAPQVGVDDNGSLDMALREAVRAAVLAY